MAQQKRHGYNKANRQSRRHPKPEPQDKRLAAGCHKHASGGGVKVKSGVWLNRLQH